jgi:hypothetical protein
VFAKELGCGLAYRGEAGVRAGKPAAAAADLRRAEEVRAGLPSATPETRFERSWALARLAGLGADSSSGVTAAEAAAFAERSVAVLREAVAAGWCRPDLLTWPYFDAVRGRDDFRKLAAEVEVRHKAILAELEPGGGKK